MSMSVFSTVNGPWGTTIAAGTSPVVPLVTGVVFEATPDRVDRNITVSWGFSGTVTHGSDAWPKVTIRAKSGEVVRGIGYGSGSVSFLVPAGTTPSVDFEAYLTGGTFPVDKTFAVTSTSASADIGATAPSFTMTLLDNTTVRFDASGSTNANAFSWDFGDGTTGTGKVVDHVYASEDYYLVTLTATHTWTGQSATLTKTVFDGAMLPPLAFSATPNATERGYDFAVTNPDNRFDYSWNFGDASTATGTTTNHTYAAAGTYNVVLTATWKAPATGDPITTTQTLIVPVTPVNMKRPGDALRLEYAGPVAYPNLVKNPSGVRGAWGWTSPVDNSRVTSQVYSSNQSIGYATVAAAGGNYFYTEPFRVDPTQVLKFQWKAAGTGSAYYKADVLFLDAGGGVLQTQSLTNHTAAGAWSATINAAAGAGAPANTIYAVLRFTITTSAGAAVTTANGMTLYLREVMAYVKSSAGYVAFNEGYTWVDILGPTSEIKVVRQALNLGTLQARILDSSLDPAKYPDLHKGVPVRLTVNTGVTREPIFYGKIDNAITEYRLGTKITLTAYDDTSTLAGYPQVAGYAVVDLPYILEGKGVPWSINGDGSHDATPTTTLSFSDNASVLDQIALSRDSEQALAWVDRNGVLQVQTGANKNRSNIPVLNEAEYSDIQIGFNPKEIINVVTVKWLRPNFDGSQTSEEITYGPYRSETSIADHGASSVTVTVHGPTESEANAKAIADAILAGNAEPITHATKVRVPIKNDSDIPHALLDIYDITRVDNVEANSSQNARIIGITHDITPTRWAVEFTYASPNAVASPSTGGGRSTSGGGGGGGAPSVGGLSETLLDAKGDLIVATADDTPARLPVGNTNGMVLMVDSTTPEGVKWGTNPAGVTDHGLLTGLGDDDHPQYVRKNQFGAGSPSKGVLLAADGAGGLTPVPSPTQDWFLKGDPSAASGLVWDTPTDPDAVPKIWYAAKGDLLVGSINGIGNPSILTGGTTGQVLRANSALAVGMEWATLSIPTVLTDSITANAANSTTTLATSGLTASLAAGGAYHFRVAGQYQTAATTTGILITPVGTGGLTANSIRANLRIWGAATNANTAQNQNITALGGGTVTTGAVAANTPYHFELEGTIVVGTAGTLDIQFRSEIASSAATLLAPLSLVVTKVN